MEAHPPPRHSDPDRLQFWSVFEQSRIPMALVDRDRNYLAVNEAAVEVFQYPRAEVLGGRAGWSVKGGAARTDAQWAELIATNACYSEDVVTHANGKEMRISYAAHATTMDDRWVALIVTLSARFEPDGAELIGAAPVESRNGASAKLTDREREVVRLVALGSTTRQIAADLHLSPDTIRSHVRNSMAKLGAHTRAQLVALVLADGLIEG